MAECSKCGEPLIPGETYTIVYGTHEVLCVKCHPPPELVEEESE